MKKLTPILTVVLAVCAQVTAQTPDELIVVRNAYAKAIDDHDIDAILSHLAEDFVVDATTFDAPISSREHLRAMWEDLYDANRDWHSSDDTLVLASGNIVVVEHASLGTNTREAAGLPWIWPHIDVYEFEGLKIKHHMSYGDYASILVQLGMMPAPEMPALVPSIAVPAPEATGLSPMEANTDQINRWNSHDAALVTNTYHADAQIFAGPLGMTLDRIATTAMNEMYYSAFPDVKLEIVRAIDLGEGWVITELLATATHQASFLGIPAAGYPTEIRVVWLTHFDADGLVTELSFYYDNLTLINQMTTAPWPLDGIWVSTVPTPLGNLILTTLYTAQDAAKTRYSGSLREINQLPVLAGLYPDGGVRSEWAGGHAEMVGRNKYRATYLGYATRIVEPEAGTTWELTGLWTSDANFRLLGPDRLEGFGNASYYMAEQDADRDGFPDEGQEPVLCVPWTWTGKRLTLMPACDLPPMPGPGQ